jgi:tetratricopeptide (TPR) repeat protein
MSASAGQERPDSNSAVQRNDKADRILESAHPLEDAGDVDTALSRYREAVDVAPDYARAHLNDGNALRKLERRDEALAAYRKAIMCDP